MINDGRIEMPIKDYKFLKAEINKSKEKEFELLSKIENLEEKIATYYDLFFEIKHISIFERIFLWKPFLKKYKNILNNG